MANESLVEGWTEPIDVTLLADGTAIDGTGYSVALVLRDRHGELVELHGTVAWLVPASGTARYSPAASDLNAAGSPFMARWKVTANGKDAYFPNGEADHWTVRL